jgi:hypothetical protein
MMELTPEGNPLHSAQSSNADGSTDPVVADQRPAYMQILGLLPPYFLEDIHKAYKIRAAAAHPDKGGSPEAFVKIQQAYDRAQEHMKFHQGRRDWMANLVEPYARQQEVVEQVRQRRGNVEIEKIDWMRQSFGDFAALTERLRRIDLRDTADADAFLNFLAGYVEHLRFLDDIDLAGSDVSDAGLAHIVKIKSLKRLNLARTRITAGGLAIIGQLPELSWINLAEVPLNWFDRRSIRKHIPQAEVAFK